MLAIDPVVEFIGKHVFDSEGKNIGKVISLERKTSANTFASLVVRKNFYSKPINVPKEDINVFKENIILKRTY